MTSRTTKTTRNYRTIQNKQNTSSELRQTEANLDKQNCYANFTIALKIQGSAQKSKTIFKGYAIFEIRLKYFINGFFLDMSK